MRADKTSLKGMLILPIHMSMINRLTIPTPRIKNGF
jgi:hypothetical protein